MTHTVQLSSEEYHRIKSEDLKYHFTDLDVYEPHDTFIAQFGRDEITLTVHSVVKDVPALKKSWSLIVLVEPIM